MNGYYFFIGVGTEDETGGIFSWKFPPEAGGLSPQRREDSFSNVSYLSRNAEKTLACAVAGDGTSGLRTYRIHPENGSLEAVCVAAPTEKGLCHVSMTPAEDRILTSSYTEGHVCVYAMCPDGQIGERTGHVVQVGSSVNPDRQEASHAHSLFPSPDGRFLVVCDLGADTLTLYELAADGSLCRRQVWKARPGTGPRHFEFHPNGKWGYLLTELSADVILFEIDADGRLQERQSISSLPKEFSGENLGAELRLSADRRFLYVSNRGCNSVTWFSVSPEDGTLSFCGSVGTTGWPRELEVSEDGAFVFVLEERSAASEGGLEVLSVDSKTGALCETGIYAEIPNAQTFIYCQAK